MSESHWWYLFYKEVKSWDSTTWRIIRMLRQVERTPEFPEEFKILDIEKTIDVRMVVFPCPQVGWQFQITDLLSSSETWVNLGIRSWKSTYLNELDAKKPLVVYISQRSEEQRLHNLVKNLTISNTGLKAVSSNASSGWTVRFFFEGDDWGFLKKGVKT